MRYEPTEELTQLLHHFDTRHQEEKLCFSKEDITLPLQLLVTSIAKLAIKGHQMSQNDPFGEDFHDFKLILGKIHFYKETANQPIYQKIIDIYNFIGCRYEGKPLSFSSEEIFSINTIYALERKQRDLYEKSFQEKFQTLDEPSKTKYINIVSDLTNRHLDDLQLRLDKLDNDGYANRQEKYEELRRSMQLAASNKRLRNKEIDKEIRKIEKKRKQEKKSLESNDSNQSNINNNSTLFTSKKAKTADSSNNNDYLYNGDDETIASHEHESKEPSPSPTK